MFYYCESGGRYLVSSKNFNESIVGGPFVTYEEARECAIKHCPDDCHHGVFLKQDGKIYYYAPDGKSRRDIAVSPAKWEQI